MIKLVIFDLDGTLLNTIADLGNSTNHALATLGYPTHQLGEYNMMVGNGIDVLFERALPEGEKSVENIAKMRKAFIEYYKKNLTAKTEIYPGVEELVHEINKRGIALAVASNKYQDGTATLVKHFFPTIPFVATLGQRQGIPTKPDPQIISDILRLHPVMCDEVLYVGDSGVDMQTAANANLIACGVSWGIRPVEELKAFNPHYIVDNANEILAIIDKHNN